MQDQLNIPESLQAHFLASCAKHDLDGHQIAQELLREYLEDMEALKRAKARCENPEDFISLEEIIERNGLEI